MKSQHAVILGYDLVSPLGATLEETWSRAAKGESGVGPLTRFPLRASSQVTIAGQVPDFDDSPWEFLSARKLALWPSPIFKHALLTTHRALERAGIEMTPDIAPRVATTFSTAIGGIEVCIDADRKLVADDASPKPAVNPNSCINMVTGKVSILTGATGPICTTITACATGNTSLVFGSMLIESGQADVAICGAVDFPIVETIVAGFASMNGAYKHKESDPRDEPQQASRPFSVDRRGFIVSEGSGTVIIASREFAEAHGLPYQLEIAGWGMTSDAYHYVAPKQETVVRAMQLALSHAGIAPEDVDLVNAHAASTKVGDQVEHDALREVFGDRLPLVSANKSQIGHCMGASSAIEGILTLEGMTRGLVLPTINYTPDPQITLDVVTGSAAKHEQEFVLKNAFGFGGCNACVVFRRV